MREEYTKSAHNWLKNLEGRIKSVTATTVRVVAVEQNVASQVEHMTNRKGDLSSQKEISAIEPVRSRPSQSEYGQISVAAVKGFQIGIDPQSRTRQRAQTDTRRRWP